MTRREALIVIPARLASVRLPRKPLLRETGKYLVQHVYDRAREASSATRVVVATDSEEIHDALTAEQVEAVMTSPEHQSGTDRVFEAVQKLRGEWEVVVNVQGDEPETDPDLIDELIRATGPEQPMVTAATPLTDDELFRDPAQVKVALAEDGRALYFSRAPIPFPRGSSGRLEVKRRAWLHLGIYAFTPATLERFTKLEPTPLEVCEGLEQLRALENGIPISVLTVEAGGRGVDTPADYREFVARYRAGERPLS